MAPALVREMMNQGVVKFARQGKQSCLANYDGLMTSKSEEFPTQTHNVRRRIIGRQSYDAFLATLSETVCLRVSSLRFTVRLLCRATHPSHSFATFPWYNESILWLGQH